MAEKRPGKIVQVIGPVIDVEFEAGHLPGDPQRTARQDGLERDRRH